MAHGGGHRQLTFSHVLNPEETNGDCSAGTEERLEGHQRGEFKVSSFGHIFQNYFATMTGLL